MVTAIQTEDGWLTFDAPTLEVARLVASASGFNVDVEPGAPGTVRLTAQNGKATIITNGSNVYEAAEKLIKRLSHEH